VIDHVVGAHLTNVVRRIFPRCGADNRETRELPRELDEDRADATSRRDDEECPSFLPFDAHAVEQNLPCSDRRERQRGRFFERERARLRAAMRPSTTCSSLLAPGRSIAPA
jgi:hypothetical protein